MTGILLTAGETMAVVTPVSAEPVETAESFRVDAGGAESNVAAHAVAMGRRARWVSRLGTDALGRRILARLGTRGIDVSAVILDESHRTGLYVKEPGGGVHYYRDGSAASQLCATDADAIDLEDVQVVHLSGITAALSGSAPVFLERLAQRARAAGIAVSFDVNHRAALWTAATAAPVLERLARRADVLFVGRDEAQILWGTATPSAVRRLLAEVPELIVKDGELGATAFLAGDEVFVPSHRVDVVEAVGAGDAFAGGYLAARMSGQPVAERLAAGHERAALTLITTADFPDEASDTESEPT